MTNRLRLTVHGALATICASISLSSVFTTMRWLMPVVGGILVVAIVSELVRRTPIPAFLGPILAAGAVLCYITAVYTRTTAYGDAFPTGSSLTQLSHLARSGFDDVHNLATPVPTRSGLVLITVVGLAAVELVVDLLSVTLRRAALAGLPLLAVFALCTSVSKHGVGWIPFGIATAGYLWLLLADAKDRITRWGRTLGIEQGTRITWADTGIAPSPLSALGRRIGFTAIAIGVVVPMVVPGLHGGLPKSGGGGDGSGHGSSDVVTINPIVTVRADLVSANPTPVLSFTTSDSSPGYLRLTSLDHFDGTTFSPSTLSAKARQQVRRGINAPATPGSEVTTKVSVRNLAVHWLPLPNQVQSVKVSGDWRYDAGTNTVFSASNDTAGLSYTAISIHPDLSSAALEGAAQLTAGDLPDYLELPQNLSPDFTDLAQSVTGKAKTPFDKAVAIQNFLTSPPFSYDTSVTAPAGSDALHDFLFKTRSGFCQQYSAAMAVLARLVDIPSRVAVGFTRGVRQQDGSYLVTTHDAHAWPELYFDGFGWVAFEPTPRGDGQAIAPSYTHSTSTPAGNNDNSDVGPKTPSSADNKTAADRKNLERADNPANGAAAANKRHASKQHLLLWALLALFALALPLPALVHWVGRHQRWRRAEDPASVAHAAWAELRTATIDAGADWQDGLTPRATARMLVTQTPITGVNLSALDRIVEVEQRARYAADAGAPTAHALQVDLEHVRMALFAGHTSGQRLVMLLWPRSTLRAMRDVTSRIADLLDATDLAGAKLSAWLHKRRLRTA